MSLPAASVPVAVLVLAWDETTPAVRALVEATEATAAMLDSVVVLVPAGPATEELTQEEFLPLAASAVSNAMLTLPLADEELAPVPALPEPATEAAAATPLAAALPAPEDSLGSTPTTDATPPAAETPSDITAATSATPLPTLIGGLLPSPAAMFPASGLLGQETFAVPGEPAVRVLRLSEYSLAALAAYAQQALPAPIWVGAAAVPAAPYLGSLEGAALNSLSSLGSFGVASADFSAVPARTSNPAPTPASATAAAQNALPNHEAAAPSYLPAEPPVALDAEADTEPVLTNEQPALLAADADAEESTIEQSEQAADELAGPFAVDVTPVQTDWSVALASLQVPAAFAEAEKPAATPAPTADPPTETAPANSPLATEPAAYAALRPATQQFDAPNLNFQIIQYARFAVPLALAAQPFGVIYAPAWPTWLAAQELRQRTGQPLVLHIATLAAADEPLDLAAGWPAEIQRQALHRADLILTETPALAYRLRRELDRPAHRVRPVPAADAAAVAQALSTAQVW